MSIIKKLENICRTKKVSHKKKKNNQRLATQTGNSYLIKINNYVLIIINLHKIKIRYGFKYSKILSAEFGKYHVWPRMVRLYEIDKFWHMICDNFIF